MSCHSRNLQSGIQVFASSFDFFGGYEEALPPQSIETLRGDKQGDKAIRGNEKDNINIQW